MGSRPRSQNLIVIGDRVLISPEDAVERTEVGLYLPQTVVEKEQVMSGWIVAVGPGIPLPDPGAEDEPWKPGTQEPRYLPMQVEVGDYALFLKKAAVEIKWQNKKYLIVPQSAILAVVRDSVDLDDEDLDLL